MFPVDPACHVAQRQAEERLRLIRMGIGHDETRQDLWQRTVGLRRSAKLFAHSGVTEGSSRFGRVQIEEPGPALDRAEESALTRDAQRRGTRIAQGEDPRPLLRRLIGHASCCSTTSRFSGISTFQLSGSFPARAMAIMSSTCRSSKRPTVGMNSI